MSNQTPVRMLQGAFGSGSQVCVIHFPRERNPSKFGGRAGAVEGSMQKGKNLLL